MQLELFCDFEFNVGIKNAMGIVKIRRNRK